MRNPNRILTLTVRNFLNSLFGCLIIIFFLAACTGLSKISEDQYLITSYKIQIENKKELRNYKEVRNQLRDEITKKPNGRLLWMRPALALHNTISEPKKEKGLKYWLKYKFGKPPVLLDEKYCDNLSTTFKNRLYHKGHFNAESSYQIERRSKTATVEFLLNANRAYQIDTLILPDDIDTLSRAILSIEEKSLIKPGQTYELENLKIERERIDDELKNMGFYFFHPDFIGFLADTTDGDHKVKLKLQIKDNVPPESQKIFSINKIEIAEDFRLENYHPDTTQIDSYSVISATNYMKPKFFLNSILYDSTSNYSKKSHSNSIRQLMGMRSYKYVNAVYTPSLSKPQALDVAYYISRA